MGESLVQAPTVANKMVESFRQVPCLQESVSFGRFEHDSLSWERWSTFPTNKYLEEVEKCSTPGSVAQKKAYFEAHYKKIAARRAELLLDQEKREAESADSEDWTPGGSVCNTSEDVLDVEKASTENSTYGTDQLDNKVVNYSGEASVPRIDAQGDGADIIKEDHAAPNLTSEVSEHVDELNDGSHVVNEVTDLTREVGDHVDEPIDGADIIHEESEVSNLMSEVIEHVDELIDGTDTVDEVHKVAELSEHTDEPNDGADIIEVEELVKNEVTEHTNELKDGAGIVYEVVKSEVTEHFDQPNDGIDVSEAIKNIQPQVEDDNEVLCPNINIPGLQKPQELILVKKDAASIQEWQDKEQLPQEKVEVKFAEKKMENRVKLVNPSKVQKAALVKKTTNSTNTKKKPASRISKTSAAPLSKSPILSTPKSSKPDLTKTAKSTTRPLVKKEHGVTPLTSKKTTRPESKRLLPTSLNMSLNLGAAKSDSASLTMRKSLIMESMGDKDIVKRAFKAFQNVTQLSSSSVVEPLATNQSAPGKGEQKGSAPATIQKRNQGTGRGAKTAITHNGQQGTQKTSMSPGVKKSTGVDQRYGKSIPASFGPRIQVQRSKSKELSKKLEVKAKANDIETTHLQSKLKVEQAVQIKKPSRSINSMPKLSSSYNQGRGYFKGCVPAEDAKI